MRSEHVSLIRSAGSAATTTRSTSCDDDNVQQIWERYANDTGSRSVRLGSASTTDMARDLASQSITTIGQLKLDVSDPAFKTWLPTLGGTSFSNIQLNTPQSFVFPNTITVPAGTSPGVRTFYVKLVADGNVYAQSPIAIDVPAPPVTEVGVDIRPGACPNTFNSKSNGSVNVVICGGTGLDLSSIDLSTVRLETASPHQPAFSDEATPYLPFTNKSINASACHKFGPDGMVDVRMRFKVQEIVVSKPPGSFIPGTAMRLILKGRLLNGNSFVGEDVIWVVQ